MAPPAVEIPDALHGERVDRAVAFLTGYSRADVQALIEQGLVRVGGNPVVKSRKLVAGDRVEVLGEPEPPGTPQPEPMDLHVVAADDHIIVLDKPAGLVVHPGAGHESGTLVSGLLDRFPEIADVGDPMRPGIVHRLDRDTSGLMVVARRAPAYDALVAMLSARDVERRYLALAWGRFDATRGVIDAPIGRSVRQPTRMAVRDAGREARTGYAVLGTADTPEVSLVECRLETGRTHQIRVHLSAVGHPVVGDATYGGARDGIRLDRPFLHAATLAFSHPVDGTPQRFESPLPSELAAVLHPLAIEPPG